MRMRKLSLVLLLVLISVMLFGMVACNPASGDGNTEAPVIPTPTPGGDSDNFVYKSSQEAWQIFKTAALNKANEEKDKRYINVDTAFVLGFSKDAYDSLIVMRFASKIDTQDDAGSEILVEFRKLTAELNGKKIDHDSICTSAKNGEGTLLLSLIHI